MPSDVNQPVAEKLDTLIRLQALALIRDFDTSKEKIIFLHDAGLKPKEIASIVKTTPHSVRVTVSREKGKSKDGKNDGGTTPK